MPNSPDGPIGPDTFSRAPYSVTIAEDGKILVKKDDWLSKYSWALYGNYNTLDVFVRPDPVVRDGIIEIEDVDDIKTGETLIHVPTRLAWLARQGRPAPKRPAPVPKPTGKADIYSQNWMACDYGGLEGTYSIIDGGINVLGWRNMDTQDTFYYLFARVGGGFGWTPGDSIKSLGKILKVAAMLLVAKKFATATYVPVTCSYPFSAKTMARMGALYWTWSVSTGGGPYHNRSFNRLMPYLSYGEICRVTFESSGDWISIPGGGAAGGSGQFIWLK